jgi:hypothetical protein
VAWPKKVPTKKWTRGTFSAGQESGPFVFLRKAFFALGCAVCWDFCLLRFFYNIDSLIFGR